MPSKPLTKETALLKMASLCARSEQCEYDIARKLRTGRLPIDDIRWVLNELRERRFIDQSRFAGSFARDKVRFAAWGKLKISAALRAKRISESDIATALASVDSDDYEAAAARVAASKANSLDLSTREGRVKLYRHLLSRGFESDVAMRELKNTVRNANS